MEEAEGYQNNVLIPFFEKCVNFGKIRLLFAEKVLNLTIWTEWECVGVFLSQWDKPYDFKSNPSKYDRGFKNNNACGYLCYGHGGKDACDNGWECGGV